MSILKNPSSVYQKRYEPKNSLDDFPTPPWATRALFEHVLPYIHFGRDYKKDIKKLTVWEPCANRGYMARPLREYVGNVIASDIVDYGYIDTNCIGWDFVNDVFVEDLDGLGKYADISWPPKPDAIITNPPFILAEKFILRALAIKSVKIAAFFVRSSFLEGQKRYTRLYDKFPPAIYAPFVQRVPLVKGRYDKKMTTTTSYAWLVWSKGVPSSRTRVVWIPPCRKQLEFDTD